MKPRPVLDWSITKLHLPLMRVSFDRCPRALISDSFNRPMFPCSRVLRILRVLLYRAILWKRGRKKRKKNGMKNWKKFFKWERIFVTDRCAEINDHAVSYKKRNGSSFHLASKFWNLIKRFGIDWNRVSDHFMKISNEKLMVVAVWYGKSILQKRIKKIKPFLERFSLFLQITDIKKKKILRVQIFIYI